MKEFFIFSILSLLIALNVNSSPLMEDVSKPIVLGRNNIGNLSQKRMA
jgi:hypothetical protein